MFQLRNVREQKEYHRCTALPELAFPQAGPILWHLGLHPLLWRAWSLILQALEDALIKKHISSWGADWLRQSP